MAKQLLATDGLSDLWFDAKQIWYPVAQNLADGAVLDAQASDNKTPVWHALNYLVYQTGHYITVFYLFVGVANIATGYLIYRYCQRAGYSKGGVIAAVLYLTSLTFTNGMNINVRSFSILFVFVALLTRGPVKRGVAMSLAVLFSQVSAVALPVVWYAGVKNPRRDRTITEWTTIYAITGLTVGTLPYIGIAAVWDVSVALEGVRQTFFSGSQYFVQRQDILNPFVNPATWFGNLTFLARQLLYVLVPAGAAALYLITVRHRHTWRTVTVPIVLAGLFAVTVIAKPLAYYWLPVVAFAAVMAGIGVDDWLN